jgi:hypothetical protein
MAEIKNSFTSSKMNQDLDDRLISPNEYREARNISIISSDSSNTGAIENILGNIQFASTFVDNGTIIGYISDTTTNSLYLLVTNYTDISPNQLDDNAQFLAVDRELVHKIVKIDLNSGEDTILVRGSFLNFSTTHPVTGINLIENLLFWTDNRNQPRKINVETAVNNPNYYWNEDQMSVAKYAPISSIKFINDGACTMQDVTSQYLPDGELNPYYNEDYGGDPNYLQDKFVRFSYRFRFDDGEYSILAPFSQIAFIPQQDGSFFDGDEDNAYRSSIVAFMRNKVNQIGLIIPMPTTCDNLFYEFRITEIDILYKESDAVSVHILDVIDKESFSLIPDAYYNYTYQSRKPRTTLAPGQLIRVYDKVPVRALSQETAGGRIIYGNYIDKNTPPNRINYKVGVGYKTDDAAIQYPLHTVKQNRNYQVGIILSDRYGRQSDVILSPITGDGIIVPGSAFFGGSSFYAPYLPDTTNILNFFGNSIKILFEDIITSTRSPLNNLGIPATGEPGLYEYGGSLLSYIFVGSGDTENTLGEGLIDGLYTNVPVTVGNSTYTGATMTVRVTDEVMVVVESFITSPGKGIAKLSDINIDIPGQPLGSERPVMTALEVTEANPTGWYSYKIVVKQNQQEYYNVYVPGVLSGYPHPISPAVFPAGEDNKTSNIVLFSDNINKVPRDLSEVGPDQRQYRSSVTLFGRVQNTATNNIQFIPSSKGFSITTLANSSDVDITPLTTDTDLYQLNTNPIIGRISTNGAGSFGVTEATFQPYLSVLETNPVVSNLDIYWETSTTGLISELNDTIGENITGAFSFIDVNYLQYENQDPGGANKYVTTWFYPVTYISSTLYNTTASIVSITNANGGPVTGFELETSEIDGINKYRIKITNNFYFNRNINLNIFNFVLSVNDPDSSTTNNINIRGRVRNIAPQIITYTLNQIYAGIPVGFVISNTVYGVNGSFGPTSTPSTITSDLKWTFLDGTQTFVGGVGVSEFTLTINPDTGNLSLTAGTPRTLITPTIVLTDSGNEIDTLPLTLNFTPGEFNPKQFSLAFNL